jgi:hypothetical protein
MTSKHKYRVILCNDGGTLAAPAMEAPIGVDGLVEGTIGTLRNTTINTLYWQLGTDPFHGTPTHRLADWYSHRTTVGSVWGVQGTSFRTAGEWRVYENAKTLFDAGTDPVEVLVEHGHRAGIDVFLSLRVNDGHDYRIPDGLDDINMSPIRKKHPDWLLGEAAAWHPSVNPHLRNHSRFAYNFAVAEVRAYILALVSEAIENYDLDGFDFDFCRQPSLFKQGETEAGAVLLTQLLRDVRTALDKKGKLAGRRLSLSMRVPPDLDGNRQAGIAVDTWIKEGLADIVIVGDPGGWNYRLPIEKYVALAKGTKCQIVAQNLCAFHEERGRSAAVLFGDWNYYTPEQYRAVAANHWQAGAQGQYIWNQHFLKFIAHTGDPQSWREIGDPEILAHLNKHYLSSPSDRGGQLPVKLAVAGDKAAIAVEVADDFTPRQAPLTAPKAVLRVLVEHLTRLDDVTFTLNGAKLSREAAVRRLNYNDCWLDFDVSGLIHKGENTLGLAVAARNPHIRAPLSVNSVETIVTYT